MDQAPIATRGRAVGKILGNTLLNVAAVGGALCLVLVVLAFIFNISLIMFKTGSMSPTIPAGSVAVIRQIPADQIAAGDVITVDRPGKLPVTHRVVATEPGQTPGERMIRLKGDANDAEDIAPYPVTQAGLVLGHVPGLANTIVWFSNPWVLGLITIAAGVLVTWTFWPHASRSSAVLDETLRGRGRDAGGTAPRHAASPARKRRSTGRAMGILAGIGVVIVPWSGPPTPAAHAAATDMVITGQYLRLTSVIDGSAMGAMAPGDSVDWQVGVSADAPSPGRIAVGYTFSGRRALPLDITTSACTKRWIGAACPGQEVPVGAIGAVSAAPSGDLLALDSDAERWILLRVTLPQRADIPHASATDLRIVVTGAGEELSAGPRDPAPDSGGVVPSVPVGGSGASSGEDAASDAVVAFPPQDLPSTGAAVLPALLWGLGIVLAGMLLALAARFVKSRGRRG